MTHNTESKLMTQDEAQKFLQDFIKRINQQNNRGTASPYFYVIQDKKEYRDDGNPEYYVLFSSEEYSELYRADSEDDMLGVVMAGEKINEEEAQEFIENNNICGLSTHWEEDGCFFTESDAKGHLEANSHHYTKDARTYVKHFWRAPEVHEFFKAISVLAGEPIEWH